MTTMKSRFSFSELLVLHLFAGHKGLLRTSLYREDNSGMFNEFLEDNNVPALYGSPCRSPVTFVKMLDHLAEGGYISDDPRNREVTPKGHDILNKYANAHWSHWPIEWSPEGEERYAPEWIIANT